MSFVDNQKIVGWAFFIIGALMVINAILSFVDAFGVDGLGNALGSIVFAIGSLIAAVLYFLFGNKVRTGEISGKMNVLTNFVNIVGVVSVVIGIFGVVGGVIDGGDGLGVGTYIIKILLGLIIIWAGKKMSDGKETTFDKILWIILVIVFLFQFLGSLLGVSISIDGLIAICNAIVYLFMLLYMFDGDVKKQMGM